MAGILSRFLLGFGLFSGAFAVSFREGTLENSFDRQLTGVFGFSVFLLNEQFGSSHPCVQKQCWTAGPGLDHPVPNPSTRWFKGPVTKLHPPLRGHQQPLKGSRELTIPKMSPAELPGNVERFIDHYKCFCWTFLKHPTFLAPHPQPAAFPVREAYAS